MHLFRVLVKQSTQSRCSQSKRNGRAWNFYAGQVVGGSGAVASINHRRYFIILQIFSEDFQDIVMYILYLFFKIYLAVQGLEDIFLLTLDSNQNLKSFVGLNFVQGHQNISAIPKTCSLPCLSLTMHMMYKIFNRFRFPKLAHYVKQVVVRDGLKWALGATGGGGPVTGSLQGRTMNQNRMSTSTTTH